jgi:hypothetical protein
LRCAADAAPCRAPRGVLADARLPRPRRERSTLADGPHVRADLRRPRAQGLGGDLAAGPERHSPSS